MRTLTKEEIADIGNYIVGTENKIMEYAPSSIFNNIKRSIELLYKEMREVREDCTSNCKELGKKATYSQLHCSFTRLI